MAFTKLTEKYLPAFIFIIDSIRKEEIEVDYRAIADIAVASKSSIDARTIQRAFELRQKLEGGFKGARIYKTSRTTLNALTSYYLEDTSANFLRFSKDFEKQIGAYYLKNKPKQELIDEVFIPKLNHIANQVLTCNLNLDELGKKSLDEFLSDVQVDLGAFQENETQKSHLKSYLLEHLVLRIEDLEGKLEKAKSIYEKWGALGLFFVTIDYENITKESLLNEFIEDFVDTRGDEDFLEDLI